MKKKLIITALALFAATGSILFGMRAFGTSDCAAEQCVCTPDCRPGDPNCVCPPGCED